MSEDALHHRQTGGADGHVDFDDRPGGGFECAERDVIVASSRCESD